MKEKIDSFEYEYKEVTPKDNNIEINNQQLN